MKIVKEAKLIYSDVSNNHNKYYYLWLYDDGTIESENGRVGITSAKNALPKLRGELDFEKQVKLKIKKGYTELKTIGSVIGGQQVSDLKRLASEEIKTNKPELQSLINRLVKANIHKITSSTNITYNDTTGLFSTPLGVVTLEAIQEARDLLSKINDKVSKNDYKGKEFLNNVGSYLRLIPQNVGMKLDVVQLFPDASAMQKQLNLLDSLEASFNAASKAPIRNENKEKVFDVSLEILEDDKERNRISNFYNNTKKRMHGYDAIKIVEIYKVDIAVMKERYERNLKNQVEVFHGTSQANLLSILKSGLKSCPPSTAAIAGALFGAGLYGAIHSSKSLGYTYGRWGQGAGDSGWLFVCDFAMGNYFEPTTYGSERPKGYDSIWAKAEKTGLHHDELIVPRESQANIKYLIECK